MALKKVRIKRAWIGAAAWVTLVSLMAAGTVQTDEMEAYASAAAAETIDLSIITKPTGPAGNGTKELKDIVNCAGAAAALEERETPGVVAELELVGAALAMDVDASGAKHAAVSAVAAINEGQESVDEIKEAQLVSENEALAKDPEHFSELVIADVTDYVNVRAIPDTEGEVVGKLYDNSAGEFLDEEDGWYKIRSGNVTGYVKAEYCVTGEDAIELAKKVGTRMATVNTTTLKVRTAPDIESEVLGLVPENEDLVILEEVDGFVKVSIEEGNGYVSTDFVDIRTDFVHAESVAEEKARLEKEQAEREAARKAAEEAAKKNAAKKKTTSSASKSSGASAAAQVSGGSGLGADVARYACQFVGNPYVYGGSSLTEGTDCSGFVMSVYSNFGVNLPHSSTSDRTVGSEVAGGIANAEPGDILCYSGHVAIYIGDGKIVHASTPSTGIVIGNANYRGVLAVRRIF